MPERSFTEVLHRLADALEMPADRRSTLRSVLTWAEANGARVEEKETSIVIHLLEDDTIFTVSLVAASGTPDLVAPALFHRPAAPESRTRDEIEKTSGESSMLELVAAINAGVLTREMNAAVGWDPELAV